MANLHGIDAMKKSNAQTPKAADIAGKNSPNEAWFVAKDHGSCVIRFPKPAVPVLYLCRKPPKVHVQSHIINLYMTAHAARKTLTCCA